MKYKIEKNTVQEILIIPLYARKVCLELYPNLYRDESVLMQRLGLYNLASALCRLDYTLLWEQKMTGITER